MTKPTIRHVSQIAPHEGPHTIPGIRFRPARQELGVTAWGMNVLELAPHTTGYPEHDHTHDGQEEVYVVLEGTLCLLVDGQETELRRGSLVRVPPTLKRKFVTHAESATLLAIGATPGKAYDAAAGVA